MKLVLRLGTILFICVVLGFILLGGTSIHSKEQESTKTVASSNRELNQPLIGSTHSKEQSIIEKGKVIEKQIEQKEQKEQQPEKDQWIMARIKADEEAQKRAEEAEKNRIEEERLLALAKEKEQEEQIQQQKKEVESQLKPAENSSSSKSEPTVEEVPDQETSLEVASVKEQPVETVSSSNGVTLSVQATAYSTNQPSLGSFTFTGIDLRSNPNVVAVDPGFIPLGSTIYIEGYGTFVAGDTGSDIVGNRIDIHMTDLNQALSFGRQSLQVQILN